MSAGEGTTLDALGATWDPGRGVVAWLREVRHTAIGVRFVVTAFIFFIAGGVEAALMRLQLARADGHLIGPDAYNRLFTTHGSTMMFLFAVPVMQGVGTYVVPLMIGARNLAFPRLSAYSYFTYVIGGLLLYVGFAFQAGPDAGWFAYTPLSGPAFSPGKRVDVWAQLSGCCWSGSTSPSSRCTCSACTGCPAASTRTCPRAGGPASTCWRRWGLG